MSQQRKRLIIAAVPKGQTYPFPVSNLLTVTVGDALARLPKAVPIGYKPLAPKHVDEMPGRDRYRLSFVPEGLWLSRAKGAPPDAGRRLTPKDSTNFRRLNSNKPSLTLRCGEALYHPTEDHYITPREAVRLQGFPDKNILEGPIRRRTGAVKNLDQHRQVANAVPPPLAMAIASSMKSDLCLWSTNCSTKFAPSPGTERAIEKWSDDQN